MGGEYEQWRDIPLEETQLAYLWTDGIYIKAGLGKKKAALVVIIGVMRDGSKRVLALEVGYRENQPSWAAVSANSSDGGCRWPGSLWAMAIWASGPLGGSGRRVSRGEGATVLES